MIRSDMLVVSFSCGKEPRTRTINIAMSVHTSSTGLRNEGIPTVKLLCITVVPKQPMKKENLDV